MPLISSEGRHDTKHNDIQHNDAQHNDEKRDTSA